MSIAVMCRNPYCLSNLNVPDNFAGQTINCPGCKAPIDIPPLESIPIAPESNPMPANLTESPPTTMPTGPTVTVPVYIPPHESIPIAPMANPMPVNISESPPTTMPTEPTLKYCRTCGNQVYENAIACMQCGVPAKIGKVFCYHCGNQTLPEAVICVRCGVPTNSTNTTGVSVSGDSLWGYFVKCLKEYVTFTGRARRREFWGFTLFSILFFIPTLGLSYFVLLLPTFAVHWRRLHDIGKSGLWSLIWNCGLFIIGHFLNVLEKRGVPDDSPIIVVFGFVIIGILLLALIFLCRDSSPGENQYGPNPKGV